MDVTDKLVELARANHPGFAKVPADILRSYFEKYKKTILTYETNGEIKAFGIYQEWPDCLNFIAIVGAGTRTENLKFLLAIRHLLPNKKMVYFDENKMELRICRQ